VNCCNFGQKKACLILCKVTLTPEWPPTGPVLRFWRPGRN
jgi:hypothetical protein